MAALTEDNAHVKHAASEAGAVGEILNALRRLPRFLGLGFRAQG